ncbi:MAG: YicC family protein [Planctomycetes bacterium]|nr:YicC family protein [Planctomycetota bacterium]
MPNGMTGFGRATTAHPGGAVTVELKSVNNRFLKVSTRLPDVFTELETELEGVIRGRVIRGSVYCNVQLERKQRGSSYSLNEPVIRDWLPKLTKLAGELGSEAPTLNDILAMPGVVLEESEKLELDETLKQAVLDALNGALDGLLEMRGKEGAALLADMTTRVALVATHAKDVEGRAPKVVEEYRDKLKARIEKLLADSGQTLEPDALIKEVAFFADRCDITEETTRLAHHCEQFQQVIGGKGEVGRRLDFIAQEMLRETNTIASKANDAELATIAVAMKSEIEKIKEQVQNLE